jgi:Undecaprenyl-phosphate glucose phosphotransferase
MGLILNRYRFLLRLCIYTLPLMAFAAAGALLPGFHDPLYESPVYILLISTTLAVWGMAAEHYQVCVVDELFREWTAIRRVFPACITTYLIVIAIGFFLPDVAISRGLMLLSAVFLYVFSLIVRRIFRSLVRIGPRARTPLKVMIVGTDEFAHQAVRRLRITPLACQVIGYVHLPNQAIHVDDAPIHELAELERLDFTGVNDVLIATGPGHATELSEIVRHIDRFCVPIRAIVDLGGSVVVRQRLYQLGGLQWLDVARSPAESLAYVVSKRAFDIVFASFAILLSSPLMLAIAIGIKLSSRGPVFFRQERVGLNGRVFSMLKFRSMKTAAAAESDTCWTVENDPRRTAFGAFLRRTSFDELPQFVNVLLGDMSVVGPRPERPHFVRQFVQDIHTYNSRHRLKVGITGWAQVNGWRGNTSIERRVEHDLYYLHHWTFAFDLLIIFLTIWSGLLHRNAY